MTSLVWFRNDLRITDHQPLKDAARQENVCGVYCFDPRHYVTYPMGSRKRMLCEHNF